MPTKKQPQIQPENTNQNNNLLIVIILLFAGAFLSIGLFIGTLTGHSLKKETKVSVPVASENCYNLTQNLVNFFLYNEKSYAYSQDLFKSLKQKNLLLLKDTATKWILLSSDINKQLPDFVQLNQLCMDEYNKDSILGE